MYSFPISLLLCSFYIVLATSQGIFFPGANNQAPCKTYSNQAGFCVRVDKCLEALNDLRAGGKVKFCGYERQVPVVCCPKRSEIIDSGVPAPRVSFSCGKFNNNRFGDFASAAAQPAFSRRRRDSPIPSRPQHLGGGESKPASGLGTVAAPDSDSNKHFVVGGTDATGEFQWMALLGHGQGVGTYNWFCSGVLINERWILTAAHCFKRGPPDVIRLGEYDYSTDTDGHRPTDHFIEKVVVHPEFRSLGVNSVHDDLALIQLRSKVQFTSLQWPVCLPWDNAKKAETGSFMRITGWGATSFGGDSSSILQEAQVRVFDSSTCNSSYSSLNSFSSRWPLGITDDLLCAGVIGGGIDSCQGDSGGPAVMFDREKRVWTMHGVVSQGYGCGLEKYPGLYVNLSKRKYLSWIKDVAFN